MDKKQPNPMTPFDEITIPKQLRFLKLLLPFMPSSTQRMLGVLIKFIELQNTVQLLQTNKYFSFHQPFHNTDNVNRPEDIIDQLFPYLSSEELEAANSFRSVMNMMEMMQMFSQSENSSSNNGSFNPMDLISGMLSPEQMEMFQSYQSIFSDLDEEK